jgi:gamma-glutamyltranspeptidase/glutathione hydrolase
MPLNRDAIYPSSAPFVSFPSRRSVVHSTKGIVSCTQPLAAQAGQRILRAGGNAADAAVAVAAALNVTEPVNTGIGGDMFCLFYEAKNKKVRALNGSGRAPAAVSVGELRRELGVGQDSAMPYRSAHSVTVPGAAAGWVDCVEKFGSGKLSLEDILAPAVELAEEGFPVAEICAYYVCEELVVNLHGSSDVLTRDIVARK